MKPGDKWVLLANAYEGTKVSYKMVLDMAEYMGLEYTPEAEWVDLYLNGEYEGNYLLCKAIYAGTGSVELADGGVLLEKDAPIYQEQEEHVNIVDDFVRSGDSQYKDYLDTESLIKHFLIDELAYNSDSGITSCYFYRNPGGKLMSGPVWDYGENTAGHYETFENNVRFLKFFLSKRISMLNDKWGVEAADEVSWDVSSLENGETHTVTFERDGVVYEEQVADGSFLQQVPVIDGVRWRYRRDGRYYSEYLPIYEDTVIYGK